jgi:hypothetical protein
MNFRDFAIETMLATWGNPNAPASQANGFTGSEHTSQPVTELAAPGASEYPVTCDEKCYDLASAFLEDHSHLFSHNNTEVLGGVIQKAIDEWIADANDNYDPTPYCSYHGSKKNCDCDPIADNE